MIALKKSWSSLISTSVSEIAIESVNTGWLQKDTQVRLHLSMVLVDQPEKLLYNPGVEIFPGLLLDVLQGIFFRPAFSIRPVAGNRIPDICNSKDPGGNGDLFAFQAARVAG